MHQYLVINCHNIVLQKENKTITMTIRGKIMMCLNGEVKEKVLLLNSQCLREKEAAYEEMFKSQVSNPISSLPLFGSEQKNNRIQQQNRPITDQSINPRIQISDKNPKQEQKTSSNTLNNVPGSSNIFGRGPINRQPQQLIHTNHQQKKNQSFLRSDQAVQTSDWRNRTFTLQDTQRNTNQTMFSSSQSDYNRSGQNAATNLFTMGSSGQGSNGPSLFSNVTSNSNVSQSSNHNRRNHRNKGPTRIG